MTFKNWCLRALLLLFCGLPAVAFFAQHTSRLAQTKHTNQTQTDTIPFRLTAYNNMVVSAVLNEVDTLDLMFHTAANSVTIITEVVPKLKNFKLSQVDSAESWGGGYTIQSSLNNQLQIGPLKWDSLQVWQNKNSGQETQGKFGINFFSNHILEINFDENYLLLHQDLPPKLDKYTRLKLTEDRGLYFLEGQNKVVGKWVPNRFLIHSGFGGALLYDDAFTEAQKLDQHLNIFSESELKDSAGNVLKTQKAILPAFRMDKQKTRKVPVSFFTGAIGRQKMSVLGGDLLKRYNWIFDFENEVVYLKSNTLSRAPFKDV